MDFNYRGSFEDYDDFDDYDDFLSMTAVNCLCKHVCRNVNQKTNALVKASKAVDYKQVWWGYGEGLHLNPELNRLVNISRIQHIIYDKVMHPIRLVIDEEGTLWVDNLHNTIAHILCNNRSIKTGQMPVYITDMRYEIPRIIDGFGLIEFDRNKIYRLLTASKLRCERVSSDIKDIGYTIGEFMDDNEISIDSMTLPSFHYYNDFALMCSKITDQEVSL